VGLILLPYFGQVEKQHVAAVEAAVAAAVATDSARASLRLAGVAGLVLVLEARRLVVRR